MAKVRYKISLDENIMRDFRNYCKANAFSVGAKLELLMKREIMQFHSKRFEEKESHGFLDMLSNFLGKQQPKSMHFGEYPEEKEMKRVESVIKQKRYEKDHPKNIPSKRVPTLDQLRRKV